MASPLAGSLAKQIYKGMKSLFLDATLERDVVPASPVYDPADPPAPVTTTYTCKAIRDDFKTGYLINGLVQANDVSVTILQQSLSVTPQSGDRITITGMGGPWAIVPTDTGGIPAVRADPANAVWMCRACA